MNGLLEEHHYLGYTTPADGERLKYPITAQGRPSVLRLVVGAEAPRAPR